MIAAEEEITKKLLKRNLGHVRKFWNRKLLNYVSCRLSEIVGVIWRLSLCLLMPAMSLTLVASRNR